MTPDDHWRNQAACSGMGVADFFPHNKDGQPGTPSYRKAREACSGCVVKAECLAEAMDYESADGAYRYGIWGGLSPHERHLLAQGRLKEAV